MFASVCNEFTDHIQLLVTWEEQGAFIERDFVAAIQSHKVLRARYTP